MITKTRYHRATGTILNTQTGPENVALFIEDDDYGWVDGEHNSRQHRVVNGSVVSISTEEVTVAEIEEAWPLLRMERDRRLAACDWTQVPDAPVDKVAWAAYRQALRDMPNTTPDPREPVWPQPPSS